MLNNVSANTIAGRELEAMSSAKKSNLVATLDKSLNTSVNKVTCISYLSNMSVSAFTIMSDAYPLYMI
jgi:hypothetical protein